MSIKSPLNEARTKSAEVVNEDFAKCLSKAFLAGHAELASMPIVQLDKDVSRKFANLDKVYINGATDLLVKLQELQGSMDSLAAKAFVRSGEKNPYQNGLQNPEEFFNFGILPEGSTFVVSLEIVPYFRSGGESYMAIDMVFFEDEVGEIQHKFVVKKAIIVGGIGQSINVHVQDRLNRLAHLGESGVPVGKNYGFESGQIYEDLYRDGKKGVLGMIGQKQEGYDVFLGQLVDIAKKLDEAGYHTLNFIADMIYDVEGKTFRYIDGGADLGYADPKNTEARTALKTLCNLFPHLRGEIEAMYWSFGSEVESMAQAIGNAAVAAV